MEQNQDLSNRFAPAQATRLGKRSEDTSVRTNLGNKWCWSNWISACKMLQRVHRREITQSNPNIFQTEASGKTTAFGTDIVTEGDSVAIPYKVRNCVFRKQFFFHPSPTLERAETSPGDSGIGTGVSSHKNQKYNP